MTDTSTSPFVFFDGRRREPLPEDDISHHSTVGTTFLANADELLPAVAEVREKFASLTSPDGFRPLPLDVVTVVTRSLQCHRISLPPAHDPIPVAYRANRDDLGPLASLDTKWLAIDRTVEPGTYIVIDLIPHPYPVSGGQYRGKLTRADIIDEARRDAAVLASWYADDHGRCWRAGTPAPVPIVGDGPVEALSAKVRRSIRRTLERRALEMPAVFLAEYPVVFDPLTAECYGSFTPSYDRPESHFLRIWTISDDPEEWDALLDRVRVCASGKVSILP